MPACLQHLTEVLVELGLKLNSNPLCSAIVSKLLSFLGSKTERVEVIKKVYNKLSQLPNTGHMEVWLQRISHPFEPRLAYGEKLCLLVKGKPVEVWNNDWISSKELKAMVAPIKIVNKAKLRSMKPII